MSLFLTLGLATLLGCDSAPPPPVAPAPPPVVIHTTTQARPPAPIPPRDPSLSIKLGDGGGSIETKGPDGSVSIDVHPETQAEIDARKKRAAGK